MAESNSIVEFLEQQARSSPEWALAYATLKVSEALETIAWEFHVYNAKDMPDTEPANEEESGL